MKHIYYDAEKKSWKAFEQWLDISYITDATPEDVKLHLEHLFGGNSKAILDLVGKTFDECEAALSGRKLEVVTYTEELKAFTKQKLAEYNATPDEWDHFQKIIGD